jgi:pyrroline-5-carboxylate reductase
MTSSLLSRLHVLFIGGGNMAQALIGGLVQAQPRIVDSLTVIEPFEATRKTLANGLQIKAQSKGIVFNLFESLQAAQKTAGVSLVVLAVKPQQINEVFAELHGSLRDQLCGGSAQAAWLSIAAGISTASLQQQIGHGRIIRAMPNTPALIQEGVTGLFAADGVSPVTKDQAQSIMQAAGQVVWIEDESLMDAVTALSGSGPAYVFRFVEALTAAGQSLGLSADQALALAKQTVKGAALLMDQSTEQPSVLRERVTSKGGTTAAALASLDQSGFDEVISKALKAARDRGVEMGKDA